MKLITKIWAIYLKHLKHEAKNATSNPIEELELRLITQEDRYKSNSQLLITLIEQETQRGEIGYRKWRKFTKTKAQIKFMLLFTSIPMCVLFPTLFLFSNNNLIILALIALYIILLLYWLCLYVVAPKEHEKDYENYLLYLTKISALTNKEIYSNLQQKNRCNFRPLFKSTITQAQISQYFAKNFELIEQQNPKSYYKPFIDFVTENILDNEGNRFNVQSFQSAFSRALSDQEE